MELSEQTIGVLRNYASINPNIVVETGNKLKTISCMLVAIYFDNNAGL